MFPLNIEQYAEFSFSADLGESCTDIEHDEGIDRMQWSMPNVKL